MKTAVLYLIFLSVGMICMYGGYKLVTTGSYFGETTRKRVYGRQPDWKKAKWSFSGSKKPFELNHIQAPKINSYNRNRGNVIHLNK